MRKVRSNDRYLLGRGRVTRRRYADPFFMRRSRRLELIAGISGRPLRVTGFVLNGVWHTAAIEPHDELDPPPPEKLEIPRLQELLRSKSAEVARYRTSGLCTEVELRTITALWIDGKGLRAHARDESVSPAAIEERIYGLRYKAVRFWVWWRAKNSRRARR